MGQVTSGTTALMSLKENVPRFFKKTWDFCYSFRCSETVSLFALCLGLCVPSKCICETGLRLLRGTVGWVSGAVAMGPRDGGPNPLD